MPECTAPPPFTQPYLNMFVADTKEPSYYQVVISYDTATFISY